jgi:hypothetical protein
MTDKQQTDELTPEELEQQNGEELPDREVMSTMDFNPGPPPIDVLPVEPVQND